MLDNLFLGILNMSFTASYVILFVLLARLFLRRIPKIFSYALWSVVLFRLVCPFSFESPFSWFSLTGRTTKQIRPFPNEFNTLSTVTNQAPNITGDSIVPDAEFVVKATQPLFQNIFTIIWLLGIATLLIYTIITLVKLQKSLKSAIFQEKNIYYSDKIDTAFVMGIFYPKIYLSSNLSGIEKEYILLHEQTHIKRFDHIIKVISFLVLCIHWFNPLVWIAFFLSAKDMEMSCDEGVIKKMGSDVKKDYSSTLLSLATGRKIIGGIPLAFGEGNTKGRIKNVLHYKKPAYWVVVVSAIGIVAVIVGLMTNPINSDQDLSFLNPDNLDAIAYQREEPIKIAEYNRQVYQYLSGASIGKWIEDTTWTKKNVSSIYELSPTYVIENIQGDDVRSQIILYENEPTLAMILYDNDWRYYNMDDTAYIRFESMILPKSYIEPFEDSVTAPSEEVEITFFVKPDEPAKVIGNTAAEVWLKSFVGNTVPAKSRISDYEITNIDVVTLDQKTGVSKEDMEYHYVVNLTYNITTATEDYDAPWDGLKGKTTAKGLYKELYVKSLKNGSFEIVSIGVRE